MRHIAFYMPSLLTYEEELMWRFIKAADYYWTHYQVQAQDIEGKPIGQRLIRVFDPDGPVWDCLKEHWALLKRGEFEKIIGNVKKTSKTMEDAKVIPRPADAPETVTLIGFPAHQRENNIGVKSSKKNENK
jgi:hypothetical protein